MIFEEPPISREQVVIRQTDRALANDVLRSLQADGTATEPDVRPASRPVRCEPVVHRYGVDEQTMPPQDQDSDKKPHRLVGQ